MRQTKYLRENYDEPDSAAGFFGRMFTLRKSVESKESRVKFISDVINEQIKMGAAPDPEMERRLQAAISECMRETVCLVQAQREIEAVIEKLSDARYWIVLFERYINFKEWHQVAHDSVYNRASINEFHRLAFQELESRLLCQTKN